MNCNAQKKKDRVWKDEASHRHIFDYIRAYEPTTSVPSVARLHAVLISSPIFSPSELY
jgi:hypothetical protein